MNINTVIILILGVVTVAGTIASLVYLIKLIKHQTRVLPWLGYTALFSVGLYLSEPLFWGRVSWITKYTK
mgnify:CR=1 FL=1